MAACHLSNFSEEETIMNVKDCLLIIGKLFQIQDDYLDVFGDPEVTGKHGTDIQEGKCSWFAAKILQEISQEDLEIMKKSYGSLEESHVKIIVSLYQKYNILEKYKQEIRDLSKIAFEKLTKLKNRDLATYYTNFIQKLVDRKK